MKFQQDLTAARLLGAFLREQVPPNPGPDATLLIPVPLHPKRLAERGYNQALEIARPLRVIGYRPLLNACYRKRHTAAQSTLPAPGRRSNLRDAFATEHVFHGRRIILVDDVYTTGATLNELARTLKRAGAEWVEAHVVARTLAHAEND